MKEEFENIDELFATELKDFSPEVPSGMWDNIEKNLPQKKSKKLPHLFYRVAASIALLFAVGSLGVYILTNTPKQIITNTSEVSLDEESFNTHSDTEVKNNIVDSNKLVNTAPVRRDKEVRAGIHNTSSSSKVFKDEINNNGIVAEDNNNTTKDESDNVLLKSAVSINSIAPALSENQDNKKSIIYNTKEAQVSDAYKEFLSKFEDLDENTSNYSKWAIGGQAGPQYSYRQIYSENATQNYIDTYNETESGLVTYAGGINIAYKPARRLSVQTGVYYSKMGQSASAQAYTNNINNARGYSAVDPLFEDSSVETGSFTSELRVASSIGKIDEPGIVSSAEDKALESGSNPYENVNSVNQYFEFLEIPLMARYAIIDRKINFHVLGGLSTNFLIASPVHLDNGDYYTETQDLHVVNYSGTAGIGLGYTFSTNLLISIEPQFKYYLNQINTDSQTKVHPYSFGVFTGVTYLF